LRYLTRLVGEGEAEDLAQETFIKVSRNIEGFRGDSNPLTWIYRIATNTAIDHLRNPSSRETLRDGLSIDSVEKLGNPDTWAGQKTLSIEERAIREEMSSCVRDVVERLPENYRSAIVLSDLEGFKDREIADIIGLTLPATKVMLHRARSRLRRELSMCCTFYRNEDNELSCDRKTIKDKHDIQLLTVDKNLMHK